MDTKSAVLAEEQAYFDRANKHRERRSSQLGEAPGAAANAGAAQRLRAWVRAKRDSARSAGEAVAFGRIDDESRETLYVGYEVIADEQREILVVNWRAPAAAPYYRATVDDPCGLTLKRSFTCSGNDITDFADLVFRQLAGDIAALEGPPTVQMVPKQRPAAVAALEGRPAAETAAAETAAETVPERRPGADPALLAELDRARDGAMHDIVTTIQAAQYDLIRAPLDQVLVIEGGPGTGKTAVALHRVSWLLYNHGDVLKPADVLVVGPNAAFTRYIRTVLPDLGDAEVDQRDIGQLAPTVARGRTEPLAVRRLKGDPRLAGLLARALWARVGAPEPAERMLFDGRFVTLSGVEVTEAITACQQAGGSYAQRRAALRARLLDLARDRGAPVDRERLEPVDNLLERIWPQFSAPAFLHALYGSRRRLTAAAGTGFTTEEIALLHRRGADRLSTETWSAADLPLLDEVDHLINGITRQYRHIVVDEAQDLSPMQARGIARRSATGSLTIVGDLAQSTGPWARDQWADLLAYLPTTLPQTTVALRYGYRVPRQVYELAARLLPLAAPDIEPLTVVRDGPADPRLHRVDAGDRAGRAVAVAMEHAAEGRFVGLICPPVFRQDVVEALAANDVRWSSAEQGDLDAPINLVSPQDAKGLEFDAVIVVEPVEIVTGDERGHRMLFIALTRTTRYLDVVAVGDPLPLGVPQTRALPQAPREAVPPPDTELLDGLARQVAAAIAAGSPEPLWDEALRRAAEILDAQRPPAETPIGRHHRRD